MMRPLGGRRPASCRANVSVGPRQLFCPHRDLNNSSNHNHVNSNSNNCLSNSSRGLFFEGFEGCCHLLAAPARIPLTPLPAWTALRVKHNSPQVWPSLFTIQSARTDPGSSALEPYSPCRKSEKGRRVRSNNTNDIGFPSGIIR